MSKENYTSLGYPYTKLKGKQYGGENVILVNDEYPLNESDLKEMLKVLQGNCSPDSYGTFTSIENLQGEVVCMKV